MKKSLSIMVLMACFVCFCVAAPMKKNIGIFNTYDLEGNAVTQEIFSKAEVTVFNIWGTFCGPCIREMPELGKWASEMDEKVQLVGLISDIYTTDDIQGVLTARMILEQTGADFTNVIATKDFMGFLQNVQFVPTTVLIDKKGNIIGEPIVGARVDKYKQAVEKYLNGKR